MIKIAGQTLSLNALDADEWIDHYISPDLVQLCLRNPHVETKRGSDLLFANYSELPRPKINQMVIPSGATRWTFGLFLVNDDQKYAIEHASRAANGRVWLEMGCMRDWAENTGSSSHFGESIFGFDPVWTTGSSNAPIQKMVVYPLPARPVGVRGVASRLFEGNGMEFDPTYLELPQGLWLLPVVDGRYFWQFADVGDVEAYHHQQEQDGFADVAELLTYLFDQVSSRFITMGLDGVYSLIPKLQENSFENFGTVLDSICWHLGLSLVPDAYLPQVESNIAEAERFVLMSLSAATDQDSASRETLRKNQAGLLTDPKYPDTTLAAGVPLLSAGGSLHTAARYLPEKVATTDDGTSWFEVSTGAASVLTGTVARMRVSYEESLNQFVADQLTADYVARFEHPHDFVLAAHQAWQLTGFDDYVLYCQRYSKNEGQQAFTRVVSWAGNLLPVVPFGGGGGGDSTIAWGEIVDADCAAGTIDIEVDWDTTNCGTLPDAVYGNTITAHDTQLGELDGYTDDELIGLYAKAIYATNRDTCDSQWRIDRIQMGSGC